LQGELPAYLDNGRDCGSSRNGISLHQTPVSRS
jgi:hypothetical protein